MTDETLTHEEMLEIAEERQSMNAKQLEIDRQFEEWFYELEGFVFRSERFWDDFDYAKDSKDNQSMVKWLRTAFEMGYDVGSKLYGGTE
jgi:hypothetical protein